MGLEHLGGEPAGRRRRGPDDRRRVPRAPRRRAASCWPSGHVGVFAGLLAGAGLDGRAPRGAARAGRVEGRRGRPAGPRRARASPRPPAGALERLTDARRRARGPRRGGAGLRLLPAGGRGRWTSCARWRTPCARPGLADRLAVDLGEVRGLDYYTGLVFRVFAPGLGFEVGGGGRYDTLLARFGRPLPAVGFMLGPRPRGAAARAPGRGARGARRPPRSGRAAPTWARRSREARARRAAGDAGPLRERGRAVSLTVALSKGKLLAGHGGALPPRAGCRSPTARAAGSWCRRATCASCS